MAPRKNEKNGITTGLLRKQKTFYLNYNSNQTFENEGKMFLPQNSSLQ
jgi:hypothetical protein